MYMYIYRERERNSCPDAMVYFLKFLGYVIWGMYWHPLWIFRFTSLWVWLTSNKKIHWYILFAGSGLLPSTLRYIRWKIYESSLSRAYLKQVFEYAQCWYVDMELSCSAWANVARQSLKEMYLFWRAHLNQYLGHQIAHMWTWSSPTLSEQMW